MNTKAIVFIILMIVALIPSCLIKNQASKSSRVTHSEPENEYGPLPVLAQNRVAENSAIKPPKSDALEISGAPVDPRDTFKPISDEEKVQLGIYPNGKPEA